MNTASISSETGDPDGSNNSSTAMTPVRRSADLRMTKAISPAVPAAGGPITYTLTIVNDGPSSANGTLVTDPLDPAISLTAATPSQGSCELPVAGIVACALGRVPVGGTVTVTITGTLSPDFIGGLGNTATATSQDPDPDPGDNTASVAVDTDAAADLAIEKELLDELVAGGRATYRLTITNAGAATARNVAISEPLNPALTLVSASGGDCATTTGGARHLRRRADVSVGARVTVEIVVDVALGATGSIPNTATVSAATRDPDPSDNAATAEEPVIQEADLNLTQGGDRTDRHARRPGRRSRSPLPTPGPPSPRTSSSPTPCRRRCRSLSVDSDAGPGVRRRIMHGRGHGARARRSACRQPPPRSPGRRQTGRRPTPPP